MASTLSISLSLSCKHLSLSNPTPHSTPIFKSPQNAIKIQFFSTPIFKSPQNAIKIQSFSTPIFKSPQNAIKIQSFSTPIIKSPQNAIKIQSFSTPIFKSHRNAIKIQSFSTPMSIKKNSQNPDKDLIFNDGDDGFDDWEDDDNDEIDDGLDDDDDDDDDEVLPFDEMNKWLRNKPRGFGEGKTYDTSIEDKLMDEIEKSRKAQEVNLEKLKSSGNLGQEQKKEVNLKKEDTPVGARVRILGLPRKKNIHRDLKLAFTGFPNIINISPVVEGNKKTRDPICKGSAFVYFRTDQDAQRFVDTYSHQKVLFGRVEKQIICTIVSKGQLSSSSSDENVRLYPSHVGDKSATIGRNSTPSSAKKAQEHVARLENQASSGSVQSVDLVSSSAEKKKSSAVSRKKVSKTKKAKAPVLSIQGSALRLKVKERAVLTGVLSKYGGHDGSETEIGI